MTAALQAELGVRIGRDYPAPVVDALAAARTARERIQAVRRSAPARAEARAVLHLHGSRKPSPRKPRTGASQAALDLGDR
jgi:deoxyribodipyrimidine photo-lyase